MTTAESVYEELLKHPGDAERMLVLADALEDEGRAELAAAYRWAAANGRWPFERPGRNKDMDGDDEKVWDWDVERKFTLLLKKVPEHARLPMELFVHMRKLPGRKYGNVGMAFVLLANVLSERREYVPL